jgi:hypothetical protein
LAGARACPNRSVVGPPCKAQGERPSADPSEEMGLRIPGEVARPHVDDAPVVNVAAGNAPGVDEFPELLDCIRINLVVVSFQAFTVNGQFTRDRVEASGASACRAGISQRPTSSNPSCRRPASRQPR